jgi:hypothetical protein
MMTQEDGDNEIEACLNVFFMCHLHDQFEQPSGVKRARVKVEQEKSCRGSVNKQTVEM